MKIYLFLDEKILSYHIPVKIYGSFSFGEENDPTENLINIEARDNQWVLYSTDDVDVLTGDVREVAVILQNNNYYALRKDNKKYLIFITDSFDETFKTYNYDDKINLIIGNDNSCNIRMSINLIKGVIAKINKENGKLVISSIDTHHVFLNNNFIYTDTDKWYMNYGDQLNILGFRIIFYKDFLMINNPKGMISINESSAVLTPYVFVPDNTPEKVTIKDKDLYSKDDYFSKSPRIRRLIKTLNMELAAPPKVGEDNVTPAILTLGPSITMLLTSLVRIADTLEKLMSGETTIEKTWPTLITSLLMLVSSFVWPTIARHVTKRIEKQKKKRTIEKYTKYLKEKEDELSFEAKQQSDIINDNLITPEKCNDLINSSNLNFWDKRIEQNDFLEVRVGVGNQLMDAEISYKKEDFTLDEDELRKKADKLIDDYKYIKNVPVGYSFFENKITAIMGFDNKRYGIINNIILQLVTFYSYEDIKLIIITNEKNKSRWDFTRYLNHTFSNDKSVRFFSSDHEHTRYLAGYFGNIIAERIQLASSNEGKSIPFAPHYIIITDDYYQLKNTDFIKAVTEIDASLGFSLIILCKKLSELPSKCNNFINLRGTQSGILKNSFEGELPETFTDEIDYNIDMMNVARKLSNIPIAFNEVTKGLPDSITFLEMEKVGKVEQLNILNRWENSNPVASLKTEIGVDEEGNLMYLDLHEKAHGPHGLIAGTTGSGKSEFIITYILSMCINYSPDEVAFILIDYKGGGLAYAFENKTTGAILPHLAGTITNLDKAEMNRTLVSIDSEVKRRQKEFNKARDLLGESTIDIYKYQRFYKEGKVTDPIPHLFIICDEFAELKSQQPDFMDNLISVARIGRSLGVHLILATQKPSGVVNDQIWSNSKFKVCLKVQDESDSKEMLKRPEAAMLKQTGRFYLQVGMNELFALGQSGWCGAKYFPSEKIVKQVDKSINFIDDAGVIFKSIQADNSSNTKIEAQGEQLGAVLKSIIEISNRLNNKTKRLWLPDIDPIILVDNLEKKYGYTQIAYDVEAIIGEYDAPESQEQGLLKYSFAKDGNTIIFGTEEIERENLLSSMIYSACKWHSAEELNIYILDYGSESLRMFNGFPQVGGMTFVGEDEKNKNLFKLIDEEIKRRKKLLIEYGGSLKTYNERNEVKLPQVMYIINNLAALNDTYQDFNETIIPVARDCERYGINIIMTMASSSSGITSRLTQFFETRYALHLQDSTDYDLIFSAKVKDKPKETVGRGYCEHGDVAHEFQTASIVKPEDSINKYLDNVAALLKQHSNKVAPRIPMLPEKVTLDFIENEISNINSVPIGVYRESLRTVKYDFLYNKSTVVASNKLDNMNSFMDSLMEVFLRMAGIAVFVVDPMKKLPNIATKTYNNRKIDYFADPDKYDEAFAKFAVIAKNPNFKKFKMVYVLYGVDKIKSMVKPDIFESLFVEIKKSDNCTSILFDTGQNIKNSDFDSWYQKVKNNADGIWIGKGFDEQQAFRVSRITKDMTKSRPLNYGYVVQENTADLVKYIEFNDMIKKEGNEDEEQSFS